MATAREACTAACNSAGFCCNTNSGGCQLMTCTAGCLMAWYAASQSDCEAQCVAGNDAGCYYTHEPSGVVFDNCRGPEDCGCPAEGDAGYDENNQWGTSNDCGSGVGCTKGCALAGSLFGVSFYGRRLSAEELTAAAEAQSGNVAILSGAMEALSAHVGGRTVLSDEELATLVEEQFIPYTSGERAGVRALPFPPSSSSPIPVVLSHPPLPLPPSSSRSHSPFPL
uniref:Uncharacterized protein n=1 Tax=Haptolina brevifila TaxID=156173 RepID=A0A7S2FQZ8_9EUKA|mmetsp:Transcript_16562/g.33314  ORF Transcript_16562/g.33314 Transcript_16562/m.33314 type:complete len:225 (+) Transcript_16562:2-676(+)